MTRKRIEVSDLSDCQYSVNNNINFKNSALRSGLCDYSDAYIVAKGTIDLRVTGNNDTTQKAVVLKSNVVVSKINNIFIDNAEDLDIVMPMNNLLECSDNYSVTSGSSWNYYRGQIE